MMSYICTFHWEFKFSLKQIFLNADKENGIKDV